MVQLCLAYLAGRPAFADLKVRQQIYNQLVTMVGPLSTTTLNGYPGFAVRKLNDPAVVTELADYLRKLCAEVESVR